MRTSFGWRDVFPWTLGLLGLFLLTQIVIAWAIQSRVVQSGQRSVWPRVDVGDTRVSLVASSVSLRNICVANPESPLRNLVEADRCDLEIEPAALFRKRTVIHDGAVTGIRFGTPRDTSGALPGSEFDAGDPLALQLDEAATKTAREWLDRLNKKFDRELVDRLESIRLTEELLGAGRSSRRSSKPAPGPSADARSTSRQKSARPRRIPCGTSTFSTKYPSGWTRFAPK